MTDSEPAWLTHLIDQRIALVEDKIGDLTQPMAHLIMTPLTEPGKNATLREFNRWDRTCDGCRKFIPDSQHFYTGHAKRQLRNGTEVIMTFGVCENCKF